MPWKSPTEDPNEQTRQHLPLQNGAYHIDDLPFTMAELDKVLSRLNKINHPGKMGYVQSCITGSMLKTKW